jgi:glycerate kinase
MRVLVAPDKFKGSLTAREVAARVAAGIGAEAPGVEVEQVPVADGGDGTLDAAVAAGFTRVEVAAHGPTGEPVTTAFAARDGVAVVEMADVSGLALLMPDRLDALGASSYGTGEVIRAALDHGCREIVLGIGGSASTDGGAGMVAALGARLLSSDGQELGRGGAALADLARLDLSGLHPALAEARVVVASDVDNPLLGPNGAAAVYGPQKGASEADVVTLDAALTRWADVVEAAVADGAAPTASAVATGTDPAAVTAAAGVAAGSPAGAAGLDPAAAAAVAGVAAAAAAAGSTAAGAAAAGAAAAVPEATPAPRDRPGAGAAGGVGFAAMAVLGAELQSGIGLVLDLVGFADHLPGTGLVVTGEGSLDTQTLSGKTPAGVAAAAREAGIPVVTVSGRVALTADQLAGAGIRRAYALTDIESDPDRCFSEAGPLLQELARALARDWLKEER